MIDELWHFGEGKKQDADLAPHLPKEDKKSDSESANERALDEIIFSSSL